MGVCSHAVRCVTMAGGSHAVRCVTMAGVSHAVRWVVWQVPEQRNSHAMVSLGRTVILFGGSSPDDGPMNDLYALACPGPCVFYPSRVVVRQVFMSCCLPLNCPPSWTSAHPLLTM